METDKIKIVGVLMVSVAIVIFIIFGLYLGLSSFRTVVVEETYDSGSGALTYVDDGTAEELTFNEGYYSPSLSATTYNNTRLNFDGVNDYANITDPNFLNYDRFVRFYVSFDFNTSQNYADDGNMISKRGATGGYYNVRFSNAEKVVFTVSNSTYGPQVTSGLSYNDSAIHHVVAVYNSSHLHLYMDGNFTGLTYASHNNSINGTGSLHLGKQGDTLTRLFNGTLDNIVIVNGTADYLMVKNLYQSKNNMKSNYTIADKTDAGFYSDQIYVINSQLMYMNKGGMVNKSTDGGVTWTRLSPTNVLTGLQVFRTSTGNLISSTGFTTGRNITVSMGSETNWTSIPVFKCQNTLGYEAVGTLFSDASITEDEDGNLFVGEYSSGNSSTLCANIYKSTNGGYTWTNSFNSTAFGMPGRHIHFVQYNPYDGRIYASMGDKFVNNNSALLYSSNNGANWTVIENGSYRDQFTSVVFTPDRVLLGTDGWGSPDFANAIYTLNSTLGLVKLYELPSENDAYIWSLERDSVTGYIIAGLQGTGARTITPYLISQDNGVSWYAPDDRIVVDADIGTIQVSAFDEAGYAYITDDYINKTYKFSFDEAGTYKTSLWLKANENNGTILYDSSTSLKNFAITGATWQNDGILVSIPSSYLSLAATSLAISSPYTYSYVVLTYTYLYNLEGGGDILDLGDSFIASGGVFAGKISTIVTILVIVVLLGFIGLLIGAVWAYQRFAEGGRSRLS